MRDKNELKLTTKNSYKFFYKSFIKDEIGSMKIKAIKYSDIKRLYSSLITDRGLKLSSVRTIHKALRPIFAFAVRDGYIASNPTEGVLKDLNKTYTCKKPKRHALTIQEQEVFINFVADSPQYNRLLPMLKDVKNALLFEGKRQMAEGFNQTVVDGYKGFIFENIYGSLYSGAAAKEKKTESFANLEGKIKII